MSDIDDEWPHHNAGLPPARAPDSSDDANNDASQLQEAAAEKPKRKSRERVWESMRQWDRRTVDDEFIKNDEPCQRKDGRRRHQPTTFSQEESH
jgi:hypothetical protein